MFKVSLIINIFIFSINQAILPSQSLSYSFSKYLHIEYAMLPILLKLSHIVKPLWLSIHLNLVSPLYTYSDSFHLCAFNLDLPIHQIVSYILLV